MKNSIRLIAIMMGLSLSLYAQTNVSKSVNSGEGFFMRNGAAYYIKGGQVNRVSGLMDLGNGRSIDGLGIIVNPDGNKFQLKEGELADLRGILTGNHLTEFVAFQNGRIVTVTNGIVTPVEGTLKFTNGETIDENGILSNGLNLQTGDRLDMSGNLVK